MLTLFLRAAGVLGIVCLAFSIVSVSARATSDPVLATVDGVDIHHSAVESLLRILPQAQGMAADATLHEQVLDHLITAEVMRGEIRRQKLDRDPEVVAQLAEMERRLFQHVYQAHIIEPQITDAVLKMRYDKIIKDLPEREEIRASHILLATEDDANRAINDVRKGKDFARVAAERSLDRSKTQGGDLGFLPKEALVESFAHATTALQPGQMSDQPVQTPFGWHVIRLEERRARKPAFEDVRDDLKTEIAQQMFNRSLEALRAKVNIRKMPVASPVKDGKMP
ncbi:MAG: cbf2 [Rhodospirillaceae bacterium]|nr:MAG: cbf2 [Rhodospirillaceae bacterium]